MLVKHPGLTLVGGLGMAVAVAIGAGLFAFFYAHLYPTIQLPEGDRLVGLENWDTEANNEFRRSLYDLGTWRREMQSVDDISAYREVARNLTDPVDGFLRAERHLIHDRDSLFTRAFGEILESAGVQPIRLPPKSPNLNAYAERFVRSIKEECLSRVVPLGEGHLRLLVREYMEHYHRERNHQGLDNRLLQRAPPPFRSDTYIRRRERLGGLLNFYYREAA